MTKLLEQQARVRSRRCMRCRRTVRIGWICRQPRLSGIETGDMACYVDHGYASVNARRTGHSTFGEWTVVAKGEQDDTYHTIDYIPVDVPADSIISAGLSPHPRRHCLATMST